MATLALDLPLISSRLSLPEQSLNQLISLPTPELINSLLERITLSFREHEQSQSEKLKLEVELENSVRAGESKARLMKESAEKTLEEVARLRNSLQSEQTLRQQIETDLQKIKSSSSASDSNVSQLQARISFLESSNRDTVALLESKNSAYDGLANEVSAKHQKLVELRREISELGQSLRIAQNAESSAKLSEQGLQQELEAQRRNNDWLDFELKTKSEQYTKFRKEKNARILELEKENEEGVSTIESLRRSETTLKARLEEVSQKSENYLGQLQNAQDEFSRQEANLRKELDTANRLADLVKKSLDREQARQKELSAELEEVRETASDELGRITAEVETEHHEGEIAKQRVAELEVELTRLKSDLSLQAGLAQRGPLQETGDGFPRTPNRGSPLPRNSLTPGGMRGGINYTQLVSDYHLAKAELDAEKKRNEKLSVTIDEMIHDMESRQPEIAELQADHDRLQADVVEMSTLVDSISFERDEAKKTAKKSERQVASLVKEGDLLRQQLRDLSSQIKVLLMEVNAQEQGLQTFTPDERSKLEALAQGDHENDFSSASDTDRFISQQLATFRNVSEVQTQNTKLLRLTRELSEKMEGDEAMAEKSRASHNIQELEDLRQKFDRSKDEIRVLVTQSQSYIRERDMFRRMLSHRGQLPAGSEIASMFGDSTDDLRPPGTPRQNGIAPSIEQSTPAREVSEYGALLKELQSHFDQYKQEAATDRSVLKEDLESTLKKNTEVRNQLSQKTNELSLATDRYDMLQGNYDMLKSENVELQKRSSSLSERACRQDVRAQQVAEELIESRGLAESLRNETANLKAEKDFWKSIEKRLVEDKDAITADRDRIRSMNVDLQNLLNEREHADANARRRLQAQVEALESDLQEARRKLDTEVEDSKRATLRREYDSQQSQSRINDLITSLAALREELAEAKTVRDRLQMKTDSLAIELKSTQERLELSSTTRQGRPEEASGSFEAHADAAREQELALEVSGLKKDLELAQNELASSGLQVEQYKAISNSAEEELQSLNESHDQYRLETDRLMEEQTAKILWLEQSITAFRSELSNLNTELLEQKTKESEINHRLEDQRISYEGEVAKLADALERSETAARFHQDDLKAQSQIAQQAQQNYENELVKHADAAKAFQKARGEYQELKLETIELKTASQTAQAKLTHNEESWAGSKERYEREIKDLRGRKDDLISQNSILHQQLESFSIQVTRLQKDNHVGDEIVSERASQDNNSKGMQELIRYLRREKEIVEVQFDLSSQEAKRLGQQLEHTRSQLEETRLQLIHARRTEGQDERQALNHRRLLETIEELNLNRESNATLRLEKNQVQSTLSDKTKLIEELQNEISPLQAKVRELEDMNENLEEELRMAQEAKQRFESRYLDILHRTDAIDPADFENLKEKLGEVEVERDQLITSRNQLQEQVAGIPDRIKQSVDEANERYQESRGRLVEQSKNKAREQAAKIKEKDLALQTALKDKEAADEKVQRLEEQILSVTASRDEAVASREAARTELLNSTSRNDREDGQIDGDSTRELETLLESLRSELSAANSKAESESAKSVQLHIDLVTLRSSVADMESKITTLENELSASKSRIDQFEQQAKEATQRVATQDAPSPKYKNSSTSSSEDIEIIMQDLRRIEEERDELKSTLLAQSHAEQIQGDDEAIVQQIKKHVEEIRVELTNRHEARVRQAEERFEKRAQNMKDAFNKRLASLKAETQSKCEAASAQAMENLKESHGQEITNLHIRHQEEIAELQRHASAQTMPKTETEQPSDKAWEPSESQIKELLQKNDYARKMVLSSLQNRERKLKEEHQQTLTKRLADIESESSRKLAELEAKATTTREQAVAMEGKKLNAKMSMSENRVRIALAKIDVVSKAAKETPEKPVSEIWEIAKDAKPTVAHLPRPNPPTASNATPSTTTTTTVANDRPSSPMTAQPKNGEIAAAAKPGSLPLANSEDVKTVQDSQQSAPTNQTQPIPVYSADETPRSEGRPIVQSLSRSVHAPPVTGPSTESLDTSTHPSGKISQATRSNSGQLGQRGGHSALPVPSGRGGQHQMQRGSQNVGRGRGRGAGRGGASSGPGNNLPGSQQGPNTQAGGSQMNAQAKQFVPQKRPREGGLDASQHANEGKRMRANDQQLNG